MNSYFLDKDHVIYSYDKEEYFFHVPGYGRQWTACDLNVDIDILYDQVFRIIYFRRGYNIIYSNYFYDFEKMKTKYSNKKS